MKRLFVPFVLFVLSVTSLPAVWPGEPSAVQLKGGETPEQIQAAYTEAITAVLPALGYGKDSTRALARYEATVHQAARPGAEPERLALCKAVGTALQGDASADAKAWLLKLIVFVGGAELVPAETRLLGDNDPLVRESARYALQHNPAPQAAEALRSALAQASDPAWQGALALALGVRQDAASVPLLVKLLAQKDGPALEAALAALGDIANADCASALARAQKFVPDKFRVAAAESWMKCAEQLLKTGQASAASRIYRELHQPAQPRSVRMAALQGSLKTAGDQAADQVLQLLTGDDADGRAIAAGFISDLSGAGLKKLAAGMGKLPPATQVMVLAALADRGEQSALPEALTAARSADETVRLAGLGALGRLGDASTVSPLIEALQTGGSSGSAARDSLQRLEGPGVNDAIIAAMQKETDPNRRGELIGVIESRGVSAAVPALLQELAGNNSGVRAASFRALGKLATPAEAPAMIKALLKSSAGSERNDGERAVVSVSLRATEADRQSAPVIAAYGAAGSTEQAILLPVLGRLGGAKSFELVKAALAGNDTGLQKAGEAALMNWPDADDAVETELLSLAQRSQKPNERTAALRAYIRVIAMPSGLPEKTRLAKFQKAMELATRDEERNFVLERLADIKHIESFRLAVSYLEQPTLAACAGNTICELAKERGLRDRNKAEFEAALNKIIAVCKDQSVVDRAKRRLSEK